MVSGKKVIYSESTLCAVPIDQNHYAFGLVARCTPEDYLILGYFFPRVFQTLPTAEEMTNLSASEAVLVVRASDYGILKKRWPLIGQLKPWDRTQWPMPRFYKKDPILGSDWEVQYDDNDVSRFIKESKIQGRAAGMSNEGSHGSEIVERLLADLLAGSR